MSAGQIHWFASFEKNALGGVSFNLGSDSIKLGIVTNSTVPSVSTADPRWGAGGSTNFSSNQVSTGGTAYTGPIALTSVTWTQSSGVVTFTAANVAISLDASGFTGAYWGILYDDTVAGKYAMGYIDLGGPIGNTSGAININFNASGILTATAS